MEIAVTGASGFVGQVLCENLVSRGHKVTPLSMRGTSSKINREILEELLKPAHHCDAIINLAAAKAVKSESDRLINSYLPLVIADLPCVTEGITKFVHISSMNVPISELNDQYTIGKREAERELFGRDVTILRPGLIWSFHGGDAGKVINLFQKNYLPFFPAPWPGNTYRPVLVNDLVYWICDSLEEGLGRGTIEILGDTKITMYNLLKDLAARHETWLIPVPTNWLSTLVPRLKAAFLADSRMQQMVSINRCREGTDSSRRVYLSFQLGPQ